MTGTDRPDRRNEAEPQPAVGPVEPPAWLEGRARERWSVLAPLLADLRVLTVADQEALGLLCDALAEYVACREVIRKKGRVYKTTTQQGDTMFRPRPEVAMRDDAWRRAQRMLIEFGLTPSARSKVSAAGKGDERDPFEEFLSNGNSG